jgi:hypothetical protein
LTGDWTEDLLLHHAGLLRRIQLERDRQLARVRIDFAGVLEWPDVATTRSFVVEEFLDAVQVARRHDPGAVVGAAEARHRRTHVLRRQLREVLHPRARHQTILDGDAHLPVLERLRPEYLLDGLRVDAVLGEDCRALAAQFQRHGHQLLGGGLRYLAADRRAPGVEQVVPAHGAERLGQLESAHDHVDTLAMCPEVSEPEPTQEA